MQGGRGRARAGISHEGKKERSLLLLRPDGCKEVGKGGIEGGGPTRSGRRLGSHHTHRAGGACCTVSNLKCCFRRKELKEGRKGKPQ